MILKEGFTNITIRIVFERDQQAMLPIGVRLRNGLAGLLTQITYLFEVYEMVTTLEIRDLLGTVLVHYEGPFPVNKRALEGTLTISL